MRIIVLAGPNSCGKTTTLNSVYSMLQAAGWRATERQQLGDNPKDFSDILVWQGQQIAFFTMGDFAGRVIEAIAHYQGRGIPLLICACNTKFTKPFTVMAGHNLTRFEKSQEVNSALRAAADQRFAQRIFNSI